MTVATADMPRTRLHRLTEMLFSQQGILLIIFLVTLVLFTVSNPRLLSAENLKNQARVLTEIGLLALPMTFIIISGGIDLSVGSILGLCAILVGYTWKMFGWPLEIACLFAIVIGCVCGFANGWFIVRIKVPPLIMTLATLAFYRGLAQGISEARSVTGYPESFFLLGQGDVLGLPAQFWLLIIGVIVSAVLLHRTTLGRAVYAIGNNAVAARFSALPVDRTLLFIYTFSGFMAAVCAIIYVSRFTTTRSDMGSGLELDVIAAVVLGGTSIFGGKGSIFGTILGLLMIQLLKNGLSLSGVTSDATTIVIGSVLIGSILLNNLIQRLRSTDS